MNSQARRACHHEARVFAAVQSHKRGELQVEPSRRTRVSWIMDGKNSFMAKAMSLFMDMDKMVGHDFEQGLANLDSAAQATARVGCKPHRCASAQKDKVSMNQIQTDPLRSIRNRSHHAHPAMPRGSWYLPRGPIPSMSPGGGGPRDIRASPAKSTSASVVPFAFKCADARRGDLSVCRHVPRGCEARTHRLLGTVARDTPVRSGATAERGRDRHFYRV